MLWRNFLLKTLCFLHLFLGGPLFCFLFFCFCSFKAFLSLGSPFSYISVFFRSRPEPQSRGPSCFCTIFCQNHCFFLHFFFGGPLVCFLFFCFCSFKSFLSLGGPFSYTFKAFLSLGGPFSYIYVFFPDHALSPKAGGPYVLAQFSAKNTLFFTVFPRGPLVLFLVVLLLLF